jgi:hypothetical protein
MIHVKLSTHAGSEAKHALKFTDAAIPLLQHRFLTNTNPGTYAPVTMLNRKTRLVQIWLRNAMQTGKDQY